LTKRVLVVDDEPTIRELVADALREAGYVIDMAANGAEALQLMQRDAPHAIVLDLMMPSLDGSGFVALKRLNPRFAAIPVLIVTATYGAYDAAERLGADACLTKPFELDELTRAVDRLVGDRATTQSTPNGSLESSTLAQA
jgi:two-component system OmpR family response regulator